MSTADVERVPCVDDLCTGTVNENGRCNYCGAAGPKPGTAMKQQAEEAPDTNAATTERESAPLDAADARSIEGETPSLHDERIPCPDDLCTGTLDAAGVCRYCGLKRQAPSGSNGVHS
ncbi:MAG: hypothetical protein HYY84_04310 [Deltaproteobacteria bacterium]|nr:hypothetical protein [Deltaproteobacteria bacterium]